jgi:hypothetical protein
MSHRSITARTTALAAAPLLLLALTACGGDAVQGTVATPSSSAPTPSSTSSAPETSSSSPEPVEESSSPSETATPTDLTLPALKGYEYDDAPGDFDSIAETLTDTGMVSGVKVAGIKASGGGDVAAVVIAAQYNDGLVDAFAGMPAKSVLESVAAGAKPSLTGKVTQKFSKVDGTDLLILSTPTVSVAITYFDDGVLAQLYGPDKASLLKIATAFITAQNAS